MRVVLKNIKNVFWLYRAYWKYGKIFLLFSSFFWLFIVPLNRFLGVYLPSLIVGSLENNRPFNEIVIFVIAIQLMIMFQPIYEDIFNMFCKNKMIPKIEARMNRDIYDRAIKTDYKYIDSPEHYDNYTWTINEYASRATESQDLVNRLTSTIISVASLLAVIALISPIAIVIIIVGSIIENAMYMITNYYFVKRDIEVNPYNRRLSYFQRIFYQNNYAADVKSTNLKSYLFDEYDVVVENKLNVIKKYAIKKIGWALTGTLTFYIVWTFVILNVVHSIYTGNIASVAAYVTVMLAFSRLSDTLNDLFYYVRTSSQLGMNVAKIRAFFDTKSEIENEEHKETLLPGGNYEIEFKNVFFKYENSDFAISNFNLKIRSGEKIAIVGENGVGKSTLVKLILRLYDVSSGEILINGKNIKEFNVSDVRRKIGVAFQTSNVYAIPFMKNIELYNDADEESTKHIFEKFGFDKILSKNNADFSTEVTKEFNKEGIMLSGGEAQKVAIARIMIGDFGLLLFDEPSSALDPIAEYEMNKFIIDGSNRTSTIVVAHRLSSIRDADRIVLVEDGSVKEIGTHNELMNLGGKYSEMFTKQAENYVKS